MVFTLTYEENKKIDEGLRKLEDLSGKISDLTCKGLFFGKNGALKLEKDRIKITKNIGGYLGWSRLSAISSTYYAASGNADSRAKVSNLFFKPFWYWIAWRCLRKAEKLSDKFAGLRPMKDMSLGELDTRACVLHKSKRVEEARSYLIYGKVKVTKEQTGTKHDLCLFLVHEAEVLAEMKRKEDASKNYNQALELSENATVSFLTKVRIMKSYGKFLSGAGKVIEAKDILNKALGLAEKNSLNDQAVKIKALLASIK